MHAGSDTNQICYESVSGDATIYTHGVRGYNLLHEYSGGKVDEYFEVKEHYKAIFDIYVDSRRSITKQVTLKIVALVTMLLMKKKKSQG